MSRFLLLLICAVLPLGLGCTAQPELPPGELLGDDDDDDDDDSPSLPDLIPESWIEGLTGSVIYDKNYVSGALEGTDCTESFSLAGVNITEVLPESCAGCEVIYSLYSSVEDDCPGGDDLE